MAPFERHTQFILLLQSCNLGATVLYAEEVADAASRGEAAAPDARLRGHGEPAVREVHAREGGASGTSAGTGQNPHRPLRRPPVAERGLETKAGAET